MAFGSVVERRIGGGAINGGVPVRESRGWRPPAGSVVRRNDGTRMGGPNGVFDGDEWSGEAAVAEALVGLPLVGMLKPAVRGDTGLGAAIPS